MGGFVEKGLNDGTSLNSSEGPPRCPRLLNTVNVNGAARVCAQLSAKPF